MCYDIIAPGALVYLHMCALYFKLPYQGRIEKKAFFLIVFTMHKYIFVVDKSNIDGYVIHAAVFLQHQRRSSDVIIPVLEQHYYE